LTSEKGMNVILHGRYLYIFTLKIKNNNSIEI